MPNPPAGWYDDPTMVDTRRYWDGSKWTNHRQEKAAAPPVAGGSKPSRWPDGWSSRSAFWKWVGGIVVAIVLAVVALRLLYGGGILGGSTTTVDPDDLATSIQYDLLKQNITVDNLKCDDPGTVSQGDVTYCRGTTDDKLKINIKVTFQSDGGYAWETM